MEWNFHRIYLTSARGFDLTFKNSRDESAELIKYGETQYDHLIVYAPSTKGE